MWKLKDEETARLFTHEMAAAEKVVAKRKVCHKVWRKSKSAEDKHTLDVAKKEVYIAVMTAQESKLQAFTSDIQSESGGKNCFRIARQREEMSSACDV